MFDKQFDLLITVTISNKIMNRDKYKQIWKFNVLLTHITTTYPDFNVKDFSLQVDGEGLQRDTAACLIDMKGAINT